MITRIQRLRTYMEDQRLDAMLITAPKHVYYLTGYASNPHERLLALILTRDGEPKLLVPVLDLEAARAASAVTDIRTHGDTDDAYAILGGLLPKKTVTLGVEKDDLNVNRYEAIREASGAERFVDIGLPLRELRAVKTPEEADRMRNAVRIVEDVLRAGVALVKPGVSEVELVAELDYRMKKLGAQGPSFDTTVLTGPKTAMPHGGPGERRVAEGELILFDLGVYAEGYASDITRTFAVGEVPAELKRIYDAVLEGNLRAIEAIRPGVSFASLDKAARDSIAAAGYGPYFNHRLGHGLGMDVHEYPSVHGKNEELAVEGMAFTVEPGIYVPGVGGVRIEDDVLVTRDGVEVLTTFPKAWTVIGR